MFLSRRKNIYVRSDKELNTDCIYKYLMLKLYTKKSRFIRLMPKFCRAECFTVKLTALASEQKNLSLQSGKYVTTTMEHYDQLTALETDSLEQELFLPSEPSASNLLKHLAKMTSLPNQQESSSVSQGTVQILKSGRLASNMLLVYNIYI